MKKILSIFFAVLLACALCACGGKDKGTTAPITTPTTASQSTTTRTTQMTTAGTTSAQGTTNSHPTETSGTTASQNERNGTMPIVPTLPPTGTAPGGSTSVR